MNLTLILRRRNTEHGMWEKPMLVAKADRPQQAKCVNKYSVQLDLTTLVPQNLTPTSGYVVYVII